MKWRKYNNSIRRSIKTGDLFFSTSDKLISRLIRFFTQSKLSHVGMFVWLGGRLFTVESRGTEGGVVMQLASIRLKTPFVLVHTNKSVDIDKILKDVGRVKYNYSGIFVALFRRTRSNQKFCSEWVAEKLGLKFDALERGISPVDIYQHYK